MPDKLPTEPGSSTMTRRKKFIINFVYFLILFGLSIVLVRYALPALTAFFVAAIVVFILRPLARVLHTKLKLNYKISSMVLVLVFYATVGVAAVVIVYWAVEWAGKVISGIPDFYSKTISPALEAAVDRIDEFVANFDSDNSFDFSGTMSVIVERISTGIKSFSESLIKQTPGIAKSVSSTLIGIIICVIATAFGLTDYDLIKAFLHNQLSEKRSKTLHDVSTSLGKLLKKYIFSYALIMFITFAEIALGLVIIGVSNPFTWAALIAIFDILPIVGSGMILFPWAIITLILGNIPRGIGLLILWAVVIVVRNIIEPKIIGNNVGMHPLLTLFAMFAGNFIYGGIGIILLPVSLALVQSLNNSGIIHAYKPLPKGVFKIGEKNRVDKFFDKLGDVIFSFFKKIFRAIGAFFKKLFGKKKPKKAKKEADENNTVNNNNENASEDGSDQTVQVRDADEDGGDG